MAYNFPDSPTLGQQYDKWTWNGEAWVLTTVSTLYVPISGGTMTGHLGLPTGPVAHQAVRKDYVDAAMAGVDLSSKVSKTGDAMTGHLSITLPNGYDFFRMNNSTHGWVFHSNASYGYMLTTNPGDPLGPWNSLRPFTLNYATGDITMNHNVTVGGLIVNGPATVNSVLNVVGAGTALIVHNYVLTYAPSSPTTGTVYLGDTYARYLHYDGTQYVLANAQVHSLAGRLWGTNDFSYVPAAPLGYTPVNKAGDSMSGVLTMTAGFTAYCINSTIDTSASSGIEVFGAGGGAGAFMTFHRPGAYAVHFGLAADNTLRMGGYSESGSAFMVWTGKHTGWPMSSGRLPHAGDVQTPVNGYVDAIANAVVTGGYRADVGASYQGLRCRYIQAYTSAWFTFPYV